MASKHNAERNRTEPRTGGGGAGGAGVHPRFPGLGVLQRGDFTGRFRPRQGECWALRGAGRLGGRGWERELRDHLGYPGLGVYQLAVLFVDVVKSYMMYIV